MKKYLFILLACVIALSPAVSSASPSMQERIAALLAQIKQLQDQLAILQGQEGTGFCYDFNSNLRFGDGGGGAVEKEADVRNLQIALEKEGFQIDDSEKKAG